jgi:hypothetical protein
MIDDFIKKLLAMPVLDLTPAAMQDFLALTNSLPSENITVESFNVLKSQQRYLSLFGMFDMTLSRINHYLTSWNNICLELNTFIFIIQQAWYEMFHKIMGGDQLLPILVALMPADKVLLEKLLSVLELAINVKKTSYDFQVFHFSLLQIAAQHALNEIVTPKVQSEDTVDEDNQHKYAELAQKLREPAYYNLIFIVAKLIDACKARMYFYGKAVIAHLESIKNTEYKINEDIASLEHYQSAVSDMVLNIMEDIHCKKFENDKILVLNIETYITYLDFFTSLSRLNYTTTMKLNEFTQKFSLLRFHINAEFENIDIELTEDIRIFLEIPEQKKPSLINLNFFTHLPSRIALKSFINYLMKKIEKLEDPVVMASADQQSAKASEHQ